MSHWRLYTIRLLVAVFLVLFVLIISHVEAQGEEEIGEWLPCEDSPDSPTFCSQPENVYEAPRNVYRGRVLSALPEYVEEEGLSADVDVEEEHEEDTNEEFYGGGFSLPHCPQNPVEEEGER